MKVVTLDAETYYDKDYSLSKMTTESYIRDDRFKVHGAGIKVGNNPSRWVTGEKLPYVLSRMPWHEIALVGHNLQFDGSILAWRYGCIPKLYIDTLGMSRALVGQQSARHGLHYITPIITSANGQDPLHKMDGLAQAMGIRDLPPWREQILADYTVKPKHYNHKTGQWEAGDAELTYEILRIMAPHFPAKELRALDWTIRKFTQPRLLLDDVLLEKYLSWVKDDKQLVIEEIYHTYTNNSTPVYYAHHDSGCVFRAKQDEPVDESCDAIPQDEYVRLRREGYSADRLTPEEFEATRKILASASKYAEALETLGVVPPTKINPKGEIKFAFAKTDAAHKALLEHEDPRVQALVAARLQVKSTIEETRAQKYLEASLRGHWPVGYSYSGAYNTHRFSGNKGGGGNPMNLKRGGTLRDCIYAQNGKVLLVFDLSQIECRLSLWFGALSSRSKGMEKQALELMREGDRLRMLKQDDSKSDLYSYFAGMMFGREIIKGRDKNERQIGKSAVLGLGFGMGPGRFMDYALSQNAKGVDASLAESTVHLYRNTYTGVRAMWRTFEMAMKAGLQTIARERELLNETGNAVDLSGDFWKIGPIQVCRDPLFGSLSLKTAGGLLIKYPDLMWDADNQGTYRDGNSTVNIFGGKFMENVAQHTARNILVDHLLEIDPVYPVLMSTYDELVLEVDNDPDTINAAIKFAVGVMTREHPQYPGLPLGVEWGFAERYGQAKN